MPDDNRDAGAPPTAIEEIRQLLIQTSDAGLQLHRRHSAALAELRREIEQLKRRLKRLSTAG